jgi:hypothetical protein
MTALLEEQTVLVAGRGSGFAQATVPVARTRGRGPRQRTAARRVADRPPSASGSAADPRADPRSPSAVLRRGNCPNGLA